MLLSTNKEFITVILTIALCQIEAFVCPVTNNSDSSDKGVGMIRVNFGPISETVYIDIILNTIIER